MVTGSTNPTSWAITQNLLRESTATYWLATVRPDGLPHAVPVLAVWVDGSLFFSAGESTRKARNLVRNPRCVVTVEEEPLDLVVEGTASKVRHQDTLQRVAGAYASIYDWHVTVRDGAFHDAAGPTSPAQPRTTSTR
jgi:nitroimidazol reductase NimA-like FMN-containing flavoprotein (pyridoxamine 5'-phosphate oxidase superfamily)